MRHVLAAVAAMSTLAGASQAATIYTNDFSTDAHDFSGFTSIATANNGEKYIGNFGNGTSSTLTIDTSNISTPLTLAFDLYAIYTTDGDGPYGGNSPSNPDSFTVTSGSTTLFNYSFANFAGNTQSYPVSGSAAEAGSDPTKTNALYGYDSTYHFTGLTVTPTGALTTITFTSNTNQSLGDEAYGFDNVVVTGTFNPPVSGAVPEPASWAMFIGGFGLVGSAMRRRATVRFA